MLLPYEDKIMLDYSAGEISSEEAKELIKSVESELGNELFHFYSGVSYRHCLIWENGSVNQELTPPHDILNKNINSYLPKNPKLLDLMKKSYDLLKNHPINLARMEKGLNPANSIWLWGEGTKPNLQNFTEKTGLKGSMISAVDLLNGMAIGSKMTSIDVDGATGTLHTNYKGKLDAATKTLLEDGNDFVYIHLEGPDECGHQGDMAGKISAIEQIDEKLLKPLLANLDEAKEDYRLLIMPDHPTPLCIRTHTNAAIPFMLYSSKNEYSGNLNTYSESSATSTGLIVEEGYTLINHLFDEKLNFK